MQQATFGAAATNCAMLEAKVTKYLEKADPIFVRSTIMT